MAEGVWYGMVHPDLLSRLFINLVFIENIITDPDGAVLHAPGVKPMSSIGRTLLTSILETLLTSKRPPAEFLAARPGEEVRLVGDDADMFAVRDFVVLLGNSLPKYNALIVDLKGYFLNLAAS